MEIRSYALELVRTTDLERKLTPPPAALSDAAPGPELRLAAPGRPRRLTIVAARQARVPPLAGMPDPAQRARILHAFANHELQAAELFAWALLAYPGAPAELRRGLLGLISDEQRHARLYLERLAALGVRFGDHPVSGFFWSKVASWPTPLHFLCAMCLTFENANLDHSLDYAQAARDAGDPATADVLDRVHEDELRHVRFGLRWVRELSGDAPLPRTYLDHVTWPLRPGLARGPRFRPELRAALGFDADFVALLEAATPRGR